MENSDDADTEAVKSKPVCEGRLHTSRTKEWRTWQYGS